MDGDVKLWRTAKLHSTSLESAVDKEEFGHSCAGVAAAEWALDLKQVKYLF